MKRRNAESGKMRRPLKRTKITDGMYGNSLLYLKFVMLWATVVMADYMLEFRFEFLWPFWMMTRSVYDSFKYHGFAFSVFFVCIALTSDLICYFFIPLQYIFFAASTYVWVQYVWYTFADKGVCLPTVALCCLVVYAEGVARGRPLLPLEVWRPLAAHCVGYPALSLGFGVKSYVGQRLRQRRQKQVRAENEFYFQLMRDALPESALDHQNHHHNKEEHEYSEPRQMNGSVRRRTAREQNGVCGDHAHLHVKLDKLEKNISQQTAGRERDKTVHLNGNTHTSSQASTHTNSQANTHTNSQANTHASSQANAHASTHATAHAHINGSAAGAGAPDTDDKHDTSKGGGKSSKCEKKEASTVREDRKRHKNKDKDKENNDSNKCTEQTKELLIKDKEAESTKENVKSNRDSSNHKEREREKERREEKEREAKEKEREREQRERDQKWSRECGEELKKVRAELATARSSEAEARRALAAAAAADRQRRADLAHLRHAHAQLQHKVSSWRSGERAALERRLSEERRARNAAEQMLRARPHDGECENEWCQSRRSAQDAETSALRRELQRARERAAHLQRELACATEQVRSLEAGAANCGSEATCSALRERATHLERSLSAETRVKLDLLSALGDAKRHMHIQEGLLSKQDKEIEELKAQMLAVMPTEFVSPGGGSVSKLRLSDGSPLDPNASVYTPKQLCSDA